MDWVEFEQMAKIVIVELLIERDALGRIGLDGNV